VVSWTQPAHGVSSCAGAYCYYTPDGGYFGADSFTYTIEDGRGASATGTIAVTVEANRTPRPADDTVRVAKDLPYALNVFANDTDPDGDALELVSSGDPAHGSVSCTAAGICTYASDTGYVGGDTFTYTVRDPSGKTAFAAVYVTVVDPLSAGADWVWRRGRALIFDPAIQDATNTTHTCAWTFGDGSAASTSCEFDHVYAELGQYDAVVEVQFTNGSTLTETVRVTVIPEENGETSDEEIGAGVTVSGTDVTYTNDADFDQGTLLNVNHDSPNSNRLQLNSRAKPFPFVNVAASARGTIVRIDADTGIVLGEYRTAPEGMARNPSRTTVDQLGNVWVANRDEASESGGKPRGSVARVGLVIGGTRNGDYLEPPFRYSTCVDRDRDGRLFTSGGLLDIREWSNEGGADSHGGVSTASDECIVNYTRVTGTATRSIALDANNDVWVGGNGNQQFEQLDGTTAQPVPGSQFSLGCGGYGALIDGRGFLWGAQQVLRYDTVARTGSCLGTFGYGLAVDPRTGHIWMSSGGGVMEIDGDGGLLNTYAHGFPASQGLAVDGSGGVWVTHGLGGASVGRVRTDGALVGVVPTAAGPTGVAVDSRGKVWAANISGSAQRIDPVIGRVGATGAPAGWVDLTVDLGSDSGPYNYSDMTGFVSLGTTARSGFWRVVQDAGTPGADWSRVSWNSEGGSAGDGEIEVEARAADSATSLTQRPFVTVTNRARLNLAGRLIEVRATLRGAETGAGPTLTDLRIRTNKAPTAGDVAATVNQDAPTAITLAGSDPDEDAVTYEIVSGPSHGALSGAGATRLYTPAAGYAGTDAFTYRVSDGTLSSAVATARITVVAAASPPPPPPPAPPVPPPPPPPPPPEREVRVDGYRCSIVGTPGPDTIRGTAKDDVICGLAGNDVLYGLGGNDVVFGGADKDRLYGAAGHDLLRGSPGPDTIVGGAGNDRLDGELGDDRVFGDAGNDTLRGRAGRDVLNGGAGADKLDGHDGNDTLLGGGDKDRILGGPGNDRLDAGRGSDNVLLGDAGNDFLAARNGARDRLSGGAGRDKARVDVLLDLSSFIEQLLG
jgi:Ca2+-binding RTX toxin-like protein/streptogramin lyase